MAASLFLKNTNFAWLKKFKNIYNSYKKSNVETFINSLMPVIHNMVTYRTTILQPTAARWSL